MAQKVLQWKHSRIMSGHIKYIIVDSWGVRIGRYLFFTPQAAYGCLAMLGNKDYRVKEIK